MTQTDVQTAGGPSTATLRLIEGGKHTNFRDGTGADLEKAIRWAPGTIETVLTGGEPSILASTAPESSGRDSDPVDASQLPNQGSQHVLAPSRPDYSPLIAGLVVDVDDLQAAALRIDTFVYTDDLDEEGVQDLVGAVESIVAEVESLVAQIDDLNASVYEIARKIVGDAARLQRLKRETREFRKQQTRIKRPTHSGTHPLPSPKVTLPERNDTPPPALAHAARPAPEGYVPGRSEQGEAGGEENQDSDG